MGATLTWGIGMIVAVVGASLTLAMGGEDTPPAPSSPAAAVPDSDAAVRQQLERTLRSTEELSDEVQLFRQELRWLLDELIAHPPREAAKIPPGAHIAPERAPEVLRRPYQPPPAEGHGRATSAVTADPPAVVERGATGGQTP